MADLQDGECAFGGLTRGGYAVFVGLNLYLGETCLRKPKR